jgi:hypothetical protein
LHALKYFVATDVYVGHDDHLAGPSIQRVRHRVRQQLNEIAVSDRGTLRRLTQFCGRLSLPRFKAFNANEIENGWDVVGVCDNPCQAARKSLIYKYGEMSEWLKEHAWKLIPVTLSNPHRHTPTHSPSTTSRNNDVHRSVPVNHGV